jgi:hypothetical protein
MIPRRRRRISVDGHDLHWSLRARRPEYRWEHPVPPRNGATLTVQHAGGRGRVAQAYLLWVEGKTSVTPEIVAIVVRRLLAAGWSPSEKGPPFTMETVDVETLDTRDALLRAVMGS